MTKYNYKAKKRNAETVSGHINANSQDEAVDLISQLGLTPVSVFPEENNSVSEKPTQSVKIIKRSKVSKKEVYIFSRQLANLLKSGVSLLKSLNIINEQTNSAYFRQIIGQLILSVKNGKSFSESLSAHPGVFSSLYITMIHAGEESGSLREMLINVSVYQKEQEEIRSKVRTALVYPIFMAFVGFISVYFILVFVVPKMAGLFSNMGNALPLPTVILLSLSSFLSKWWLWVVCGLSVIILFIQRWVRSHAGITSELRILWPKDPPPISALSHLLRCSLITSFSRTGTDIFIAFTIETPLCKRRTIVLLNRANSILRIISPKRGIFRIKELKIILPA